MMKFGTYNSARHILKLEIITTVIGAFIGYLLTSSLHPLILSASMCRFSYENGNEPVSLVNREEHAPNKSKNIVFIGVMTASKYLNTRAKAIYETWGKLVPGEVAFFSSEFSIVDFKLPLIKLRGVDDSYPPQKKSFMMLKYMYDNFLDDFEFFMRTDDDVYVHPEKLAVFLKSLNSSKSLFIGQPGKGNSKEIGHLALDFEENFCMGGPGIVFTRDTLIKVIPNIKDCLQHLKSTHEDVELGRCVQKYANIPCTWSYEMQSIFYHNANGSNAFRNNLKLPEVHHAITLHPVKNHEQLYRLHHYMQSRKIRELEYKVVKLMRELKFTVKEVKLVPPNFDMISDGIFIDGLGREMWSSNSNQNLYLFDYFDHSLFSVNDQNPKHKIPSLLKESINDVIGDDIDLMNSLSQEHGRTISFKSLLYGYYRKNWYLSLEYILDVLLLYKRFRGMKATVPVRHHANLQVPYGLLHVREYSPEEHLYESSCSLPDLDMNNNYNIESHLPDDSMEDTLDNKKIHFILPLSGRFSVFYKFMETFKVVCLEDQENVVLKVVIFISTPEDEKLLEDMEAVVASLQLDFPSAVMTIHKINSTFARAKALQMGADLCEPDDLLFLIDVDMVFTHAALARVRHHTVKGMQVYFPIVFSQFDPDVIGNSNSTVATVLTAETGFWRTYGFGIGAIYQEDLFNLGGFNTEIVGWGKEDVDLYDRIMKSDLHVFRAPDPDLIHVFHSVECQDDLTEVQLQMCMGTKYNVLGSTSRLANLMADSRIIEDSM